MSSLRVHGGPGCERIPECVPTCPQAEDPRDGPAIPVPALRDGITGHPEVHRHSSATVISLITVELGLIAIF